MASSGMLRRVALVRTEVSEKLNASFIRVTRIVELGTTLDITSNRRTLLVRANVIPSSPLLVTLMMEGLRSSEKSVLTKQHGVPSQKEPFLVCEIVGPLLPSRPLGSGLCSNVQKLTN
jgi:hypothetical protein